MRSFSPEPCLLLAEPDCGNHLLRRTDNTTLARLLQECNESQIARIYAGIEFHLQILRERFSLS